MKTIVITSGYFNPLHPGHIECFELCKDLGDELRVIINNDKQVQKKTGNEKVFQDENYRMSVVSALKPVDHVILAIDQDESVCMSLRHIVAVLHNTYGKNIHLIFGKGGDRFASNIPELEVCKELGIEIKDGLGAKTHNSSEYRMKQHT